MVGAAAARLRVPIAYVNQVGGNDALIFDGGSMLIGRDGRVLARGPLFEEAVVVAGEDGAHPAVLRLAGAPALPPVEGGDAEADEVYRALVLGLRDYARKCGFRSAVIGLSGGIDSALTACLASDALRPENVFGVAMPNLLRLLRRDPQVAAGPIALAMADMVTLLVYFNLARWMLGQ